MTEKMKSEVVEILNNHIEEIHKFDLHGVIWFCVDIFGHLDYDFAFFKSYMSANDWAEDQFNKRCEHSDYVVIYFDGNLFNHKYKIS